MGIQDFWKQVKNTGQETSFTTLALTEGFDIDRRGTGMVVIGIDTSIWFGECQTKFHQPGLHAQSGENPELRALFYRLAALLRLPVIPIFVFDGPKRPVYKRGKVVKYKPIWYSGRFEKLIKAFGFHCHIAPGEAEAELALLNRGGFIDAILTEDCDAFLFGARIIIRTLKSTRKATPTNPGHDAIKVYTSDKILLQGALSQAGMLLAAVLNGGDYDQIGLQGCGPAVAFALAQDELAVSLHTAATTMSPEQLQGFLDVWRADLRYQLSTDSHGHLGRHYQALADNIPEDFPDATIVQLYAMPVTSWSGGGTPPEIPAWPPQLPDLAELARLCDRHFSWGHEVPAKFSAHIWTGYCTRQLIWLRGLPPHPEHPFRLEDITRINKSKLQKTSASPYKMYQLQTNLVSSLNTAVLGLGSAHPPPRGLSTEWAVTMWIPASIVEQGIGRLATEQMRQRDRVLMTHKTLLDPPPVPAQVQKTIGYLGTFDLTLDDEADHLGMIDAAAASGSGPVIDLTESDYADVDSEIIDLTND